MACQSHVNKNIFSIAVDIPENNDNAVQVLNLHGNCIRTMDGLQRFVNLKELSLSSNWIESPSFAALRGLVHLCVLNLSANRITTTLGFPVLPALRELSLAYNSLSALDGFIDPLKFPSLEILDLRDNQIADLSALSPVFYLQTMRVLRLQTITKGQSNPVCATPGYPGMLLDRISTLETLDGEDVTVLREIAALAMPKYSSVAKLYRQTPLKSIVEDPAQHEAASSITSGREWSVLDARLRLLESQHERHQTRDDVSFMDEIDSEIHQATSNLRNMHRQSLEQRRPPISGIAETKKRRGHQGPSQLQEESEYDDEEAEETFAVPSQAKDAVCQVDMHAMADAATQCDVYTTNRGVQCISDDSTEQTLRTNLQEAVDRAKRAETRAVQLTAEKSASSLDHDAMAKELKEVQGAVALLKQLAATDREKLTAKVDECDEAKAALAESMRRVESLQVQIRNNDDKWKRQISTLELALKEAKDEADSRVREVATAAQAKQDESTSQIRQLKADMQELKYTLEDAYAKYAAKEKEVSSLRHEAFLKGSELDKVVHRHQEELSRREKEWKVQEVLVQRQFRMSLHEVEMEFRLKQSESILKLKQLTQAYQGAVAEAKQSEAKNRAILQSEASLKGRVSELTSQLQGVDKKLAQIEESCQHSIREHQATIEELEEALDAARTHTTALETELHQARDVAKAVEDLQRQLSEATATLQVKNIMLDDQAQQIMALRRDNDAHRRDHEDLQEQIRDLEQALDESLVRQHDMERDIHRVQANADKLDQWEALQDELDAKVHALEYIEKEMHSMRKTITKQDEIARERLEALQDEHEVAIKAAQATAQAHKHEASQWEAKCGAMEARYRTLHDQNRQLHRSIRDHELRVQTTENEMKVLLQQMEKERQAKRQHMKQVSHLLHQLDSGEAAVTP
ncbi:hypothetical protein H310_00952 [Aphanomyces invadans]|uniref:U2A'/phosphoprotein 32 family A C-terminal domain-containing protein n=1 Tax=Aphanomyces invadans TaxID=157072 RepID=A0A024UPX8_9STRA|nr:hypothetical protein H310_00952 [Aphanomyces invadans]ETW08354.1 hypothetical protein H310_00952 [Aphanomyces invadans]|eukprot:XP_008862159.1 hypothetical protein H310_00952 [Aphanomyces invadans]